MNYFYSIAFALLFAGIARANTADSIKLLLKTSTGGTKAKQELELAEAFYETDAHAALQTALEAERSAIRSQEKQTEVMAIILQGDIYFDKQNFPQAKELYSTASTLASKYAIAEEQSLALNNLGKVSLRTGALAQAILLFRQSLELREKLKLKDLISNSYNNIGIAYREAGNLDSASIAFKKSHTIAKEINDFAKQGDALNNMAGVYWKEGNFSQAIDLYEQSLAMHEKTEDLRLIAKSLNNIGIVYKDISNYNQSLKYHLQALKIKQELGDRSDVAYSYNNIGSVYLRLLRPDSAIHYYSHSLAIREELGNITETADSYVNLALAYKEAKNFDSAIVYFGKAQDLRQTIGNQAAISNTANLIGNLYLENLEFDKALDQYYKSLNIRVQIGRKDLEAQSLNNIGLLFKSLNNYEKALNYFNQSLEIYKQLNNTILVAYQHHIIGGTYWEMENYGQALHYYGLSLEARKEIGDKRYIASSLKNIGIVHKDAGNIDRAKEAYLSAIEIYNSIFDTVGTGWATTYLGNLYKDQKQYSQANENYQKAKALFLSTNYIAGLAAVYYNLGELYQSGNQLQSSISMLKHSVSKAQDAGDKELLLKGSKLLADTYEHLGNFESAYKYRAIFSAVNDSIANTEIMKRFADIQIAHEIEKKDIEIEQIKKEETIKNLSAKKSQAILLSLLIGAIVGLVAVAVVIRQKSKNAKHLQQLNENLRQLNDDLKRSEANLAHANMTKTKFFSIIAHDLKNPFSSFIGLTNLLIENFTMLSDEKRISFLQNLNLSANKTYFLLENLLDWSRSETASIRVKQEDFRLADVVDDVFTLQKPMALNKEIFLVSHIAKDTEMRADKNMITTVIRNLVSNAIKYTPEHGTVSIYATATDHSIDIRIADTGIGLGQEDTVKLFDKTIDYRNIGDPNSPKGSGLGLALCKEFVEKHRGRIWAESEKGKGSSFYFSIPQ